MSFSGPGVYWCVVPGPESVMMNWAVVLPAVYVTYTERTSGARAVALVPTLCCTALHVLYAIYGHTVRSQEH